MRERIRGLTVLLKVHRFFGLGNICLGELIGHYFIQSIKDEDRIEICQNGVDVIPQGKRRYTLCRGDGNFKELSRIRKGFFYNLLDNLVTRINIKSEYLGQPFYSASSTNAISSQISPNPRIPDWLQSYEPGCQCHDQEDDEGEEWKRG